MNRVRAALLTTFALAALLTAAPSAMAQSAGDAPSTSGRTMPDVMTSPAISFSTDATLSTGASDRFETPSLDSRRTQATVNWRFLPAEERRWLVRLAVASMWRWLGL